MQNNLNSNREQQLCQWLKEIYPEKFNLSLLSGDASFRRYYRLNCDGKNIIAVDSDPRHEKNQEFIAAAKIFSDLDIVVPEIFHYELASGFLLLSDLGDDLYQNILNQDNKSQLLSLAFDNLFKMAGTETANLNLPNYDRNLLQQELRLFDNWLLAKYLQINLNPEEQQDLTDCYTLLEQNALKQPQIIVHRDYHSRNLIFIEQNQRLAVIDFQDAVCGPLTYDLASLMHDRYVRYQNEEIKFWVEYFYQELQAMNKLPQISFEKFFEWFELMTLQRLLKIAGIFVRLFLRDHKPNYLPHVVPTLLDIYCFSQKYAALDKLAKLLEQKVLPQAMQKLSGDEKKICAQ